MRYGLPSQPWTAFAMFAIVLATLIPAILLAQLRPPPLDGSGCVFALGHGHNIPFLGNTAGDGKAIVLLAVIIFVAARVSGEQLAAFLCASCHTTNGELLLSGGNNLSADSGMPLGDVYPPNITTGGRLKELSDADVFRILRSGVRPNGQLTAMGFFPVRALSDEDAKAVIAYLRQAPAVDGQRPPLNASPLLLAFVGLGFIPAPAADKPIQPVITPPKAATVEYDKYVADFGDCRGCHGEKLDGNAPPPAPPGATNITVIVPK
jgi:mono/diheme cytochrome c family protein